MGMGNLWGGRPWRELTRDERRARFDLAASCRERLHQRFPLAIMPKRGELPLKLGIHRDMKLVAPDLTIREIKLGLWDYTEGGFYLDAVREGAPRIGLNGAPAGVVTAVDEQFARRRRATLRERMNEKLYGRTKQRVTRSSDGIEQGAEAGGEVATEEASDRVEVAASGG